jgi:hypothetical protein
MPYTALTPWGLPSIEFLRFPDVVSTSAAGLRDQAERQIPDFLMLVQQKTTKKKREVGNKNSSSTVPKFKLALQMMITTLNLN